VQQCRPDLRKVPKVDDIQNEKAAGSAGFQAALAQAGVEFFEGLFLPVGEFNAFPEMAVFQPSEPELAGVKLFLQQR